MRRADTVWGISNALPTPFQPYSNALPRGCVFQPLIPRGRWNTPRRWKAGVHRLVGKTHHPQLGCAPMRSGGPIPSEDKSP